MANKTISMMKVRQILKLYYQALGKKKIAERLGISKNTVKHYIEVFKQLKTTKEEIMLLSDVELNALFHPPRQTAVTAKMNRLIAFFPTVDKQMRKRGMTVIKVYQEYKEKEGDEAYSASQFYNYYSQWSKRIYPSMHIEHKVGDKMYVDYAGGALGYVDKDTGELKQAQVFVAILGWSQYAYVEAVESQSVEYFIMGCENALRFYDGVPLAIVPDNLKSAVFKPNRYEPELNMNFAAFADYYGTSVLPARVRKPKDKALVENMVKLSYQRIYTNLPEHEVFTLEELNEKIREHLEIFNKVPLTGKECSRKDQWLMELPALQPLPEKNYEMRKSKQVTVSKNGHVILTEDGHYYSVPYEHIGKKLIMQYSRTEVSLYHRYQLICTHKRTKSHGNYTTEPSHLSPRHQNITEWNPDFFIERARKIDPIVELYITNVINKKKHREQSYKSCQGILAYAQKIGNERLISVCKLGLDFEHYSFKMIEYIWKNDLDVCKEEPAATVMPEHQNIRGGDYYQ